MSCPQPDPPLLFYSYSHKDAAHLAKLQDHLTLLKREGKISEWFDQQIRPGDEWDPMIKERLDRARMILLLVSANFLASNYIWSNELTRALERHERREAVVIPVVVSPVDWRSARVGDRVLSVRLGDLQALPPGAKPVTRWGDRDEAWFEVARGIRAVIEHLPDRLQA